MSSKAEVRSESPSYRNRLFVEAALAATLCVIENLGFGVYRSGFHCDPCVIEGGGSGRKPLLQKPSFRRSGFSRDPCVIENQGFLVTEAAFTATPASSKAEVRGESPSYKNRLFVGAALAATLCVIENLGFGVYRSGFHCDPCVIENEGSGRKIAALPLGGPEMGWRATARSCPA